jgi:hypothetical protein
MLRERVVDQFSRLVSTGAQEPARLIICGESPLDADGAAYPRCLNERVKLPLAYGQIVLEN